MSIKLKPTVAPKPHAAAPQAKSKTAAKKLSVATTAASGPAAGTIASLNASLEEAKVASAALKGPALAPEGPSMATIPEAFPIDALSEIHGKGVSGDTFLLDGGSLRGLKLQVRRVVDGKQPGFELTFQLTPGKLDGLLERMKLKGAEATSTAFRGVVTGDDGIAKYTDQVATITSSSTHAPPDLDSNASAWTLRFTDGKGAVATVVHDKAALSLRGMVRLDLRGDDSKCTEQLQSVVNTLGLQYVLAPPTPRSKKVNLLMRALWQGDYTAAAAFAKKDLDKLKVGELEAALVAVGYTPERIAGLSYQEVFPGHFTVVDPAQTAAMVEAGARYLYSTVTTPEHVHSILQNGQKSSLQRYKDGIIIDGMSTAADFVTGGGCGVFTRLVTQNAIYDGESWTGRTYKLLQNAAQLGRTDWYGWDGDYFGRRWKLKTDTNFGPDLVKKIDAKGNYQTTNELIFTAGNRPQNIDRVIATSEEDRQALLKHLAAQKYQPHNGLSLEEFVVLSPQFLVFGPSPYAGVTDIAAFTAEALAAVKDGAPAKLQWLLYEGPKGPERVELERSLLLGGTVAARDVLFKSLARAGKVSLSPHELDDVIEALKTGNAKQKETLKRLTSEAAESLFRSGSAQAYELLKANKPESSDYQPYGLDDVAYLRIFNDLAAQQVPGQPRSKAFELALDVRVTSLLEEGNAGFKTFLEKYPLVIPANPAEWLAKSLDKVQKNGAGKTDLALYLAQLKDSTKVGAIQQQLIEADNAATLDLLKGTIAVHGGLHLPGADLAAAVKALPAKSATRQHLLESAPAELLKTAEPSLLKMLQAKYKGPYDSQMGIYGGTDWWAVIEGQLSKTGGAVNEVVKKTLEIGASQLLWEAKFKSFLATQSGLYDVGTDAAAFAATAAKELTAPGAGVAKLCWMMLGPEAAALRRPAIVALLKSTDYQSQEILTNAQDSPGKFAATPEELRSLVGELSKDALTKLLGIAGRDVLLAADAPTLKKLSKHVKDEEDVMSMFGLWGTTVTTLLAELETKVPARDFVLEYGARSLIKSSDEGFLGYMKTHELGYAQLGKDATWAATTIKEACDNQSYYWTSEYYKNEPEYQKLPAGAQFLLKDATASGEYDPAVLAAIEKDLGSWGWAKAVFDRFLALAKDLPEPWKKKLKVAYQGKST